MRPDICRFYKSPEVKIREGYIVGFPNYKLFKYDKVKN